MPCRKRGYPTYHLSRKTHQRPSYEVDFYGDARQSSIPPTITPAKPPARYGAMEGARVRAASLSPSYTTTRDLTSEISKDELCE